MNPALSDVTTVEIEARREGSPDLAGLRATGSVLKDPGFLRLYGQVSETEAQNAPEDEADGDEAKVRLPAIAEGDVLALREAKVEDHETQPPPRFNEASLVKFMEENGIGRPSTYADILRKIEQREYARKQDRRFIPTPLGRLVVDLMKEGFEDFFQTEYTARMEEELDEVEEGKVDWRQALRDFDGKFSKDRDRAKKQMHSVKAGLEMPLVRSAFTDFRLTNDPGDTCPESGHPLKLRMGKAGLFIACSGYPECTWTVDIPETEEDPVDPSDLEGQICEECGSPMRLRTGKNGSAFLGCTAYPKCRNAISVRVSGGKAEARPDEPTGEKCPVCGHDLVKRHGRFGEYVSCSNYPNCRYKPPKPVTLTGVTCPECHKGQILERKGRFGPFYGCARYPECTKNFRARPVPHAVPEVRDRLPAGAREEGRVVLRVRGGGLRLRRVRTRPRPLPAHDRGHRGGPPGRPRRRDHEGRRQENPAPQANAGRGATPREKGTRKKTPEKARKEDRRPRPRRGQRPRRRRPRSNPGELEGAEPPHFKESQKQAVAPFPIAESQ